MFSRSLAPGHIKSGKLRALAVTGAKRLPYLPDVPTLTEAGIPGMEIDAGWFGMFAPVNTAPPVVARLQSEVRTALANPLARERFTEQGFVPVGNTPPEFRNHLASEFKAYARWCGSRESSPNSASPARFCRSFGDPYEDVDSLSSTCFRQQPEPLY